MNYKEGFKSEESVNFRQKRRVLTPLHNVIIGKRHNFRNFDPDFEDFEENKRNKMENDDDMVKENIYEINERIKIIRVLCENGADLKAKAGLGALTPIEFATNDPELNCFVEILKEFENEVNERDSRNEIFVHQ